MFVPEPVISLSIKPKGLETPNFSRALNRFQKEDPTFKVHIDHESKQVDILIFRLIVSGSNLMFPVDHHLWYGRAPPRDLRRTHEERVQHRLDRKSVV